MIMIKTETNVLHFLIINATTLIREPVNTTNYLTVSNFFRSFQASFSWYSLFYQSNASLVEVISKTVSY